MLNDRLKGNYYRHFNAQLSLRKNIELQLTRLQTCLNDLNKLLDESFDNITVSRNELIKDIHDTELKLQYINILLNNYEDRIDILINERFLKIEAELGDYIVEISSKYKFNIFNIDRPIGDNNENNLKFSDEQKYKLKFNSPNQIAIRWFGGKLSDSIFLNNLQNTYAHILKIDSTPESEINNFISSNLIFELFIFHPTLGFIWVIYSKDSNYNSNFYIKYKSKTDSEIETFFYNDTFDKSTNSLRYGTFDLNMLLKLDYRHANTSSEDCYIKVKTNLPSLSLNGTSNILLGITSDKSVINNNNVLNLLDTATREQFLIDDPNINDPINPAPIETELVLNYKTTITDGIRNPLLDVKYIGDSYNYQDPSNINQLHYSTDNIFNNNINDSKYYNSYNRNNIKNSSVYYKYSDLNNTIESTNSFFENYKNSSIKYNKNRTVIFGEEYKNYIDTYKDTDIDYYNNLSLLEIFKDIDYANFKDGESIIDFGNINTFENYNYINKNNPKIVLDSGIDNNNITIDAHNYTNNLPEGSVYDLNKPDFMTDEVHAMEKNLIFNSTHLPYNSPITNDQSIINNNTNEQFSVITNDSKMKVLVDNTNLLAEDLSNSGDSDRTIYSISSSKYICTESLKDIFMESDKYNKTLMMDPVSGILYEYKDGELHTVELRFNKSITGDFGHPEITDVETLYYRNNNNSYALLNNFSNFVEINDEIYFITTSMLLDKTFENASEFELKINSYTDLILMKSRMDDVNNVFYFEEVLIIPGLKNNVTYADFINIIGLEDNILVNFSNSDLNNKILTYNIYNINDETSINYINTFVNDDIICFIKCGELLMCIIIGYTDYLHKININGNKINILKAFDSQTTSVDEYILTNNISFHNINDDILFIPFNEDNRLLPSSGTGIIYKYIATMDDFLGINYNYLSSTRNEIVSINDNVYRIDYLLFDITLSKYDNDSFSEINKPHALYLNKINSNYNLTLDDKTLLISRNNTNYEFNIMTNNLKFENFLQSETPFTYSYTLSLFKSKSGDIFKYCVRDGKFMIMKFDKTLFETDKLTKVKYSESY